MGGSLRWHSCSTTDFPLKRSKVAQACQQCRTKKMRCDGNQPCYRCAKDKKQCQYDLKSACPPTMSKDDLQRRPQAQTAQPLQQPLQPQLQLQQVAQQPVLNNGPYFQWSRVQKLSFQQDLYVSLGASPLSSPTRTISDRHSQQFDRLPPLLFEFFHLSAQPITIWTKLYMLFQKWSRLQKSTSLSSCRIPADIAKEAIHLFLQYNTLYTLFIDSTELLAILDRQPFFPSAPVNVAATITTKSASINDASDETLLLLLDAILSLTFLAAGQSLGTDLLLDIAHCFYNSVQQRWVTLSLPSQFDPSIPASSTQKRLARLTKTAILLIHFQCSAISEEQAYMTSGIARGMVERLLSMTQASDDQDIQKQHGKNMIALRCTLHAWQIWFAVYLYDCQSLDDSSFMAGNSLLPFPLQSHKQQSEDKTRWTWTVLTRYTCFLESLLKSNQSSQQTTQEMMDKMESLLPLGVMDTTSSTASHITSSSEQLVDLYHAILTIQLFATQWLPHLHFFSLMDRLQNEKDEDRQHVDISSNPSKALCVRTSQRIIQKVSMMMATGQDITTHRTSSPSLLPARYRALCLAATILVPICQQQITSSSSSNTTSSMTFFSCSLDESIHQMTQILKKDIQTWSMARQCLYYLQLRSPLLFSRARNNLENEDEDPPSATISIDTGTTASICNVENRSDDTLSGQQQGFLFTLGLAQQQKQQLLQQQVMEQQHLQQRQQRSRLTRRDDIDQEQLNKLSFQHDQMSRMMTSRKRSWRQKELYTRKRHQTYPVSVSSSHWLSVDPIGANGSGPFLVFDNDTKSVSSPSSLISTFGMTTPSTFSSVDTNTEMQASSTTQSIITPLPTTATLTIESNGDSSFIAEIPPLASFSSSIPASYHSHNMADMTIVAEESIAATTSTVTNDNNCGLPSYQSQFSRSFTSSSYHQLPSFRGVRDTFTASMMETLHTAAPDHSSTLFHMAGSGLSASSSLAGPKPLSAYSSPSSAATPLVSSGLPSSTSSAESTYLHDATARTTTASRMNITVNPTIGHSNQQFLSDEKQTEALLYYFCQHQPSSPLPNSSIGSLVQTNSSKSSTSISAYSSSSLALIPAYTSTSTTLPGSLTSAITLSTSTSSSSSSSTSSLLGTRIEEHAPLIVFPSSSSASPKIE